MFNRQRFNRDPFNKGFATEGLRSLVAMRLGTKPVTMRRTISLTGSTNISIQTVSAYTYVVLYNTDPRDMALNNVAVYTRCVLMTPSPASLELNSRAAITLSGESSLTLTGLILKPGDELLIDTGEMTVLLNGQNAMKYFTKDSEFIEFLHGINDIVYSDKSASRKVTIDVLWKDRWL